MKNQIFISGGNGRLARELQKLRPQWNYLSRKEFDVTNSHTVENFFAYETIKIFIHLAAATDVIRCEQDHKWAYRVNVLGTRNLAKECVKHQIPIVYTSTDAVFYENGPHKEDDPVNPVNYYALTKALGEEAVRSVYRPLITRSTLKERGKWHSVAPMDMWQTITFYDEFAPILIKLVENGVEGTVHIGGQHWNIYEYAKKIRPDVKPVLRKDLPVPVPRDCRLDTSKLQKLLRSLCSPSENPN